jgi:GTP-binding protein HflX
LKLDEKTTVLLTDTVGFVSRLPTYMIDAFKSTLEESLTADLILLLIDSFEAPQDIRIKYSSCWQVLEELKVDRAKVFVVLTKYDNNSTDAQKIDEIAKELHLENPLVVSSKTGYGVHKLKTIIKQYSKPRG